MSYIKKRATAPFNGRVALEQIFKEAAKPSNARYDREIDFAAAAVIPDPPTPEICPDRALYERVNGDGVGESNSFINKVKYGINPITPALEFPQTVAYDDLRCTAPGTVELFSMGVLVPAATPKILQESIPLPLYGWADLENYPAFSDSGFKVKSVGEGTIEAESTGISITMKRNDECDIIYKGDTYTGWYYYDEEEAEEYMYVSKNDAVSVGDTLYAFSEASCFTTEPSPTPYESEDKLGTNLYIPIGEDIVNITVPFSELTEGDHTAIVVSVDSPAIHVRGNNNNYYLPRCPEMDASKRGLTPPLGKEEMYAWGSVSDPNDIYNYYTDIPTPQDNGQTEEVGESTHVWCYDPGAPVEESWIDMSEEPPAYYIYRFLNIQN